MRKSIILSLLSVFLLASACQSTAGDGGRLNPNMFSAKAKELKNETILDVRTPGEYNEGFIENAINVDWNGGGFDAYVAKLDKNKPVMVYCLAGGRSGAAASRLKELGFKEVYDLAGGMMQWKAAGMPVTNKKKVSH
ncbi:MAG: rhodanese-like domain-containing protein [Chitinophagales bacterium]|nr:rhodanese-like domain-containing protein [Chitinophagaceae bacterium]MCB9063569.1 rhodanese-like domain-containing protein [Chitinophagales bacterium]